MSGYLPAHRPRRLRQSESVRNLVRETVLHPHDFIYPIFVVGGSGVKKEISALDGQYHWSVDRLVEIIEKVQDANIQAVLLFGAAKHKDNTGSDGYSDEGILQQAIREIKKIAPELTVITDVCLCVYTDDGHCELGCNDATLPILGKIAVSHAKAGADIVAPSGMMDGMISAMRDALDATDYTDTAIMSYAVKYASSFYGPFRSACDSSPQSGDRKTYQMDPANSREALKEAALDIEQGADFIMCKPALSYLDIIYQLKNTFDVPLAAYHVSGEYAMVKAAGKAGLIDADKAMRESLLSIKRAGADLIISYAALDLF